MGDLPWDDDLYQQPPSRPVSLLWVLALVTLFLVLWSLFRPILWWQYSHIPGGSLALPFFGNLSGFRDWDLARVLHWSGIKHGRHVYKIWVGSTPCIVINQPELAHHACMRVNARFQGSVAGGHLLLPPGPSRMLDSSVLLSNGTTWRLARRAFEATIMQPHSLAGLLPVMQVQARLVCDSVATHLHSTGTCNILKELETMHLRLFGSTAYGVSLSTDEAEGAGGAGAAKPKPSGKSTPSAAADKQGSQQLRSRLGRAVRAMLDQAPCLLQTSSPLVLLGLFMPALRPLFAGLLKRSPDPLFTRHAQVCTAAADASTAAVEAWKVDRRYSWRPESSAGGSGTSQQPMTSDGSLLGHLLESRARDHGKQPTLKDEEVAAQPLAFMLAGASLTHALAFCVYLLSQHPHVEAKVMEEVDEAIYQAGKRAAQAGGVLSQAGGAAGGTSSQAAATREQHDALCASALRDLHADDLPYTEAVLKETMRLFPSVPVLRRQAPPEGMEVDGVRIPGGAVLLIPVSNFHHDERYFPQPGVFRPERFLEAQAGSSLHSTMMQKQYAATTPYAFIPFGVGGRMCVGYKYSLVQGVLTLAALYSRFTFRLHPGQVPLPIHTGVVVAPSDGVWVNIEERPPWVPELPSPTTRPAPPQRLSRRPSDAADLTSHTPRMSRHPSTAVDLPSPPKRISRHPSTAMDLPSPPTRSPRHPLTAVDVPSPSAGPPAAAATGVPPGPTDLPSTSANQGQAAADAPCTSADSPSAAGDVHTASDEQLTTAAGLPSTDLAPLTSADQPTSASPVPT